MIEFRIDFQSWSSINSYWSESSVRSPILLTCQRSVRDSLPSTCRQSLQVSSILPSRVLIVWGKFFQLRFYPEKVHNTTTIGFRTLRLFNSLRFFIRDIMRTSNKRFRSYWILEHYSRTGLHWRDLQGSYIKVSFFCHVFIIFYEGPALIFFY